MNIRRKIFSLILCAAVAACGSACSEAGERSVPPPEIQPFAAFRYAEQQVAFGARPAGSPGAEKLFRWMQNETASIGVQEESCMTLPDGRVIRNLICWYPAKPAAGGKFVILAAHYDTKVLSLAPDFQGANDGASGVAALLAILQQFKAQNIQPPLPVCFAFFDGEEALISYSEQDGLHGSRLWAETLNERGLVKDCAAMILLDMVGDKDLTVRFPADTDPGLLKTALRLADSDPRFVSGGEVVLDDHVPFQKLGIPAIDFIDFEYGPGNAYWHTRHDTLDRISGESIAAAANLALKLIWETGK